MSFASCVTVSIARFLYGLAIAVTSMASIAGLVVFLMLVDDNRWVLLCLPFATFVWFIAVLWARVTVEYTVGFLSTATGVRRLADRMTGPPDSS